MTKNVKNIVAVLLCLFILSGCGETQDQEEVLATVEVNETEAEERDSEASAEEETLMEDSIQETEPVMEYSASETLQEIPTEENGIIEIYDGRKQIKTEETEKGYVPTGEYCSMEDLGEMDYYLFCHTEMSTDVGPVEFASVVINRQTQTVEEAKKLYQEFKERLPLEEEEENVEYDVDKGKETEIFYVSPDCKWVITNRWNKYQTINTQILFYEKENVKKVVEETRGEAVPILIVKDGDTYREMEEEHYKKLSELRMKTGYIGAEKINSEGDLYAGTNYDDSLLTVGKIEDGAERWNFSLQGIKDEARKIRDNMGYKEGSVVGVYMCQFEGNEREGWIIVQAGTSSFFRIAYPSGEVTYLGEYLYSPCFSPDGKYVAYSGIDYDNVVAMDLDEQEQLPPQGIYIKEMATGKTAYIDWDRLPENRSFMWLEKESFEEYMADIVSKE